ncbi:MAG: aspartate aminotransferase family protein [Bacteroidota bacterium]
MKSNEAKIPPEGVSRDSILSELENMKTNDIKWRAGRSFSYVYFAGDEILSLVQEAYLKYFSSNALNPSAFQSLRRMESEVVRMSAHLFQGGEDISGSMTSGGTESILMAVKTAREWARRTRGQQSGWEIVLPASAHPAFHKACHYFDVKPVNVAVGDDFRALPEQMAAAVNERTVMLVGSAPSYPHGLVDPISEIAAIAKDKGLLCHVDACVGGFMLPFLRAANYPIPAFDFAVEGVTSISADIHKFGYAAKGASVVLYRTGELRKDQFYVYTDWSGGIYGSPTMTGTRPGGAIAAAWAVMRFIGMDGYIEKARLSMETALKIRAALTAIPGLKVLGQPDMCIFALSSDEFDIYEVGDELGLMGWSIDRQQLPPSLHFTITPTHVDVVDELVADVTAAVRKARRWDLNKLGKAVQLKTLKGLKKVLPDSAMGKLQQTAAKHSSVGGKRSAAMYGMMGELQGSGNLEDMVKVFLDKLLE